MKTWRRKRALGCDIRELEDDFRPKIANASGDEEQHLLSILMFKLGEPQGELAQLETERLRRLAHRWNVCTPRPELDHRTGRWYIPDEPRRQLWCDIVDARRKSFQWWVQVVVMPMITLFGVSVGLFSVLVTLKSLD